MRIARLLWGVGDQALFSGTSFLLAIAVARSASPEEFGAFGVAYVIYVVLLGTVEAFTAEVVAVQGARLEGPEQHELFRDASGAALFAGIPVMAVGGVLALSGGASTAAALCLCAPLLFVQDVWRFAFFASGRPRQAFANDATWMAGFAAGLVVISPHSPAGLVWLWCGCGVACGVLGAVQCRCSPRPSAAVGWWRARRASGGRYAGEFLALYGSAQAVLICVGLFVGLTASAGFRGAQLIFGPIQVALSASRIALFPVVSRARSAGSSDAVWTVGFVSGVVALLATIAWGVGALLVPRSVGEEFLGGSWEAARGIVPWFIWGQAAAAFGLGALAILRAADVLKSTFRVRLSGAATMFALGSAGACLSGAQAAAGGIAVGATATTVALWWQASKHRLPTALADG